MQNFDDEVSWRAALEYREDERAMFFCALIYDAVSISAYVASDDRMISG